MSKKRASIIDKFIINDEIEETEQSHIDRKQEGAEEATEEKAVNEISVKEGSDDNVKTKTNKKKTPEKKPAKNTSAQVIKMTTANQQQEQNETLADKTPEAGFVAIAREKLQDIRRMMAEDALPAYHKKRSYWEVNANITISSRREVIGLLDYIAAEVKAVKVHLSTEILLLGIEEFLNRKEQNSK